MNKNVSRISVGQFRNKVDDVQSQSEAQNSDSSNENAPKAERSLLKAVFKEFDNQTIILFKSNSKWG